MSAVLQQLRAATTPVGSAEELWKAAVREAMAQDDTVRSAWTNETAAERLARLRTALEGEVVAFHDRLDVTAYAGTEWQAATGRRLWQVRVPLTLFPKRDQGYDRVECTVEFAPERDGDWLRVVGIAPKARDRVFAHAEMGLGGALQVAASKDQGVLPVVLAGADVAGIDVKEAALRVYGKFDVAANYELYRECTLGEIVRGIGARWRLDDPHDPRRVAMEGHAFTAILETGTDGGPIHAAGYVQAYSSTRWLTATLASVWEHFTERVRAFFARGIPVEAYGEWRDILKPAS